MNKKYKKRNFASKKGSVALPAQSLIGIVLGFIAVILIFGVFFALIKMFVNPPSAGSAKSLSDFQNIVDAILSPENNNASCYWTVMFIEQNWALVGFNKNGIKSHTEDIVCSSGDDCIEERCCNGYCNDVKKPKVCGGNPCTCLCSTCSGANIAGSCAGSLGGGDCSKAGATCTPITGTPLERFYIVDHDYCTRTTGKVVGAVKGAFSYIAGNGYKNENDFDKCDLIYDSESCTAGATKGLQRLVTISRDENRKTIYLETWSSKSNLKKKFPNAVDCKAMVRNLKKTPTPVTTTTTKKIDKGKDVRELLDEKKVTTR